MPYEEVMPDTQLFSSPEELKDKLMKMKFSSMGAYKKLIENGWDTINHPLKMGDFQLSSVWMEKNLHVWEQVYKFNPFRNAEQVIGGSENG